MIEYQTTELALVGVLLLLAIYTLYVVNKYFLKKKISDDETKSQENSRISAIKQRESHFTKHPLGISDKNNKINKMALIQNRIRETKRRKLRYDDDDFEDFHDSLDNDDISTERLRETVQMFLDEDEIPIKLHVDPERWNTQNKSEFNWHKAARNEDTIETPKHTTTTPEPETKISSTSDDTPSSGSNDSNDDSGGGPDD